MDGCFSGFVFDNGLVVYANFKKYILKNILIWYNILVLFKKNKKV